MNNTEAKPTREELLQKLRNKKQQVGLHRMTKKNRECVLEKLETKAKSEQEEMMNQLKKCTPEQLKAFGLNDEMIDQILKKDATTETEQSDDKLQEKEVETPLNSVIKSSLDNMFDIPDIKIPKMSAPINAQIVNTL
jgi:hypothetical protein